MKLCIRIQFIQSCWKNLVAEWDKIAQRDWLQAIHEGSNKTRFEYCKTSKDHEIHVLAIHGQTGGNMISPELMGHVKIPYDWQEFVFQVGCAHGIKSILDKRIIAGGEKKGGRQTIFFTPLNLCGENSEEEAPGKSLAVSRKVHYRSFWTCIQDTENCVKLFQAQDQCLRRPVLLWVKDQVPADCIYRVISQNGEQIQKWDNVNSETRTESDSQKQVQNWAGAVLCNRLLRCMERLERYPDVRTGKREDDRNIGEQCSSSSWQQHSNTDTSYFEIDLRIQGVPDDIVQQDANRMKKTNEKLKNWRNGSRAASIREDLSREDGDLTFNEKLQRVIYEMGSVDLFEFGKTTATFHDQSSFSSTCWRKYAFRMWLLSTSKRWHNQQN